MVEIKPALLIKTLPQLERAQRDFQDQARAGGESHAFLTSWEEGNTGLGLVAHAQLDSEQPEPRFGRVFSYRVDDLALTREPIALQESEEVVAALGSVAVAPNMVSGMWGNLVAKVVDRAIAGDWTAREEPLLTVIESGESALEVPREGLFRSVKAPARGGRGPDVARWQLEHGTRPGRHREIHIMDDRYAWLLGEDPFVKYTVTEVLDRYDDTDYLKVAPAGKDRERAESVYSAIDEGVERVARGETMYGSFRLVYGSDSEKPTLAFLDAMDGTSKIRYVLTAQPGQFDVASKRMRQAQQQGCFFEQLESLTDGPDGIKRYLCSVVEPVPADIPPFFKYPHGPRSGNYLNRRFSTHPDIEELGNLTDGVLFRRKPTLDQ